MSAGLIQASSAVTGPVPGYGMRRKRRPEAPRPSSFLLPRVIRLAWSAAVPRPGAS
jgi:hypothetical protein